MLAKSDFQIETAVRLFSLFGVDGAFVVPTETGLKKSILDAPYSLRKFLSDNELHDFDSQAQGPDSKVTMKVGLIEIDKVVWRNLSLYRPLTKSGDPRIWISKLGEYANPWNLIGFFLGNNHQLYAINFSNNHIRRSIDIDGSPANSALGRTFETSAAIELHEKLKQVNSLGPVRSMRSGSTGIGFTLETLLGIKANSSKNPDYKGIELKSGRRKPRKSSSNRSTLFSRVPDWKNSRLKSGRDLLIQYGYKNKHTGRLELYCTLNTKPNPQGLYLEINESTDQLHSLGRSSNGKVTPVVHWEIEKLIDALKTKHAETFWVSAIASKAADGVELFHYDRYVHTRAPLVSNFRSLLALGIVSVDFTLSQTGPTSINDHGYIFKMHAKDFHLLFPAPREIHLGD